MAVLLILHCVYHSTGCAVTVHALGRILVEEKETAMRQLDHERQRTAEGKQAYDQPMSTHTDVESKLSNQVGTSF